VEVTFEQVTFEEHFLRQFFPWLRVILIVPKIVFVKKGRTTKSGSNYGIPSHHFPNIFQLVFFRKLDKIKTRNVFNLTKKQRGRLVWFIVAATIKCLSYLNIHLKTNKMKMRRKMIIKLLGLLHMDPSLSLKLKILSFT
jgi:hypothetical protein